MTVRRLLSELDSRELTAWMAYESVEPFGVPRDNLHAGLIAATVANVNRRKNSKPFQPTDFVLQFGKREEPTVEAMMAQMGMIAAVQNAAVGEADASGTAAPSG